jgi:hypothetical protein
MNKLHMKFLSKLHDMGDVDMRYVNRAEIAEATDLTNDQDTFREIARYLEHEELIEVDWQAGGRPSSIRLTPAGLSEVQAAGQPD